MTRILLLTLFFSVSLSHISYCCFFFFCKTFRERESTWSNIQTLQLVGGVFPFFPCSFHLCLFFSRVPAELFKCQILVEMAWVYWTLENAMAFIRHVTLWPKASKIKHPLTPHQGFALCCFATHRLYAFGCVLQKCPLLVWQIVWKSVSFSDM